MKKIPGNIIISRTDSIGDVILTLPVATILKQYFPRMKIGFMGKAYTRPVIEACPDVDTFIDVNDFLGENVSVCGSKPEAILHVWPVAKIAARAKQLNIPLRIGTNSRIFHWVTCNRLVKLSRRKSSLHEAQLNLKLLQAFGISQEFTLDELGRCLNLTRIQPLHKKFISLIDQEKYNLILHPKSQGNGREWGLDNFIQLIRLLDRSKFKIFISGVEKEKALLQPLFDVTPGMVTDITGTMSLAEFMSFIAACNGLVASGTGPVHLAAASGIDTFGIYPPIRPMHPERWAPLGMKVRVFVLSKICDVCKGNKIACKCMMDIQPFWIKDALDKAFIAYKNRPGDVVVSA